MKDRKPEPIADQIKCSIWHSCVHGAGCMLSDFERSDDNPKEMPLIIIEDGIPVCQDAKRG